MAASPDTTILSTDVDVWYLSNNRAKMMDWGGTTGTYSMNELYSAAATLLDESTTIDDGSAIRADTPVEYTAGKIDSGDNDPWYITYNLMEHITGGSLKTEGWTRVQDSNTGIVAVLCSSSNFDSTDIGHKVDHAVDNDSGTLLEIIPSGANDWLIIRPDSDAAANNFDSTANAIDSTTETAHTATQTQAAITGDQVWANIYSIGTIDPEVHLYVYQGARATTDASERVLSVNSTTLDYWGNGHIDICVPLNDRTTASFPTIDDSFLRVYGRKGGDLFTSFEVENTDAGGRNPVPLASALDLDAGYSADSGRGHGTTKISTAADWSSTFINGEIITGAGGGRGILDLTNSTFDSEMVYWPIATVANGGALTAMGSSEVITGGTSGHTATSNGAPGDDGPALTAWFSQGVRPTIVFANTQVDVDNDTVDENYGITIDCKDNRLTEVYQWMKYICGYTQVSTDEIETAEDLIFGEEYNGAMAYFGYSAESGSPGDIAEGEAVTQLVSGATGVIISHDYTTNDIVLLRGTRGTFAGTDNVEADDDSDWLTPDETGNFAYVAAAPLGTFAGGTYFGARGVVLANVHADDENAYILTDIEGNSRQRPTSITITVTNLHGNAVTETDSDIVAVYALTGSGGDIEKDTMTCTGGETVSSTTLTVDTIPTWVPSSGRLVLVDVDDSNTEYVLTYDSYSGAVFTLNGSGVAIANMTAGTDENTIVTTGDELDGFNRGDLITNDTRGASQWVTSVNAGTNTIQCSPDITSQVQGDTVYHNTFPDITVAATDKAFACVLHAYPTSSTAAASIVYPGSEFFFRVKVRNSRETDLINGPIKPYSSDGSTTGTNQSIPTVRTIDTVFA